VQFRITQRKKLKERGSLMLGKGSFMITKKILLPEALPASFFQLPFISLKIN